MKVLIAALSLLLMVPAIEAVAQANDGPASIGRHAQGRSRHHKKRHRKSRHRKHKRHHRSPEL